MSLDIRQHVSTILRKSCRDSILHIPLQIKSQFKRDKLRNLIDDSDCTLTKMSIRFNSEGNKLMSKRSNRLFVFVVFLDCSLFSFQTKFVGIAVERGVDNRDVSCKMRASWQVEGDVGPVVLTGGVDVEGGFRSTLNTIRTSDVDDGSLYVLMSFGVEEFVDCVASHDVFQKGNLMLVEFHLFFLKESVVLVGEWSCVVASASDDGRSDVATDTIGNQATADRESDFVSVRFHGAETSWRAILSPVAIMEAFR